MSRVALLILISGCTSYRNICGDLRDGLVVRIDERHVVEDKRREPAQGRGADGDAAVEMGVRETREPTEQRRLGDGEGERPDERDKQHDADEQPAFPRRGGREGCGFGGFLVGCHRVPASSLRKAEPSPQGRFGTTGTASQTNPRRSGRDGGPARRLCRLFATGGGCLPTGWQPPVSPFGARANRPTTGIRIVASMGGR